MATKRINLALQGGGAHGAFTWGVLDRLLEEEDLEIAGISGTSAGALNGAAVKAGLSKGGTRADARRLLDQLWTDVGAIADPVFLPWLLAFPPDLIAKALEYSWPFTLGDTFGRLTTPYVFNPAYRNALEPIVAKFDFDTVCCDSGPRFFICATNVRSGKVRVFGQSEVSPKAIMASACLPTLFRAVEIDDPDTGTREAYWDGGYTGNPALFPLFEPDLPQDILVVNINPLYRGDIPMTARDIQNRINEISFNSSLLRELRAIGFVKRLLDTGALQPGSMKDVYLHIIADDDLMRNLSVATKLVPHAAVLAQLKESGRKAAELFLATHRDAIGNYGTVDPDAMVG